MGKQHAPPPTRYGAVPSPRQGPAATVPLQRAIQRMDKPFDYSQWHKSQGETVTLYRRCTAEEAINTKKTMKAGGRDVTFSGSAPKESECVEQVGNNEGMGGKYTEYSQKALEQLLKLGITPSKPKPKLSPVVEYSIFPSQLFSTSEALIKVQIKTIYISQGSGSSLEGYGVVVYRGAPLESVELQK